MRDCIQAWIVRNWTTKFPFVVATVLVVIINIPLAFHICQRQMEAEDLGGQLMNVERRQRELLEILRDDAREIEAQQERLAAREALTDILSAFAETEGTEHEIIEGDDS